MKWLNHEIVTGILVYAYTKGDLASTLAAMAGGLFPDMLEGRPPQDKNKLRKWQAIHRGVSHWFLPYAMVAAIVIAPSVFHIAEDALCGHVPSLNPCTRIGVRFFTVGSPKEYLFSLTLAALLFLGMSVL